MVEQLQFLNFFSLHFQAAIMNDQILDMKRNQMLLALIFVQTIRATVYVGTFYQRGNIFLCFCLVFIAVKSELWAQGQFV